MTTPEYPSSLPPEAAAYARQVRSPPFRFRETPRTQSRVRPQFFNLARQGNSTALTAPLAAGLPANLTNDKGDTLLMLAACASRQLPAPIVLTPGERSATPATPHS